MPLFFFLRFRWWLLLVKWDTCWYWYYSETCLAEHGAATGVNNLPSDDEETINNLDEEQAHYNMVGTSFSGMVAIELMVNSNLLEIQNLHETHGTTIFCLSILKHFLNNELVENTANSTNNCRTNETCSRYPNEND